MADRARVLHPEKLTGRAIILTERRPREWSLHEPVDQAVAKFMERFR